MKFLRQLLADLRFDAAPVEGGASRETDPPVLDQTPDRPVSFGLKTNWFAVRTDDAGKVIAKLGLSEPRTANWNSGLNAMYGRSFKLGEKQYVFVSPPVKGWVLVVGNHLPYPEGRKGRTREKINSNFERLFWALSEAFPEVHFFGSYRVVGFVAWARSRGAKIERVMSLADGEVLANVGNLTPEERALGLLDVSGLSLDKATAAMVAAYERPRSERNYLNPDEATPQRIAEAWGRINPGKLDEADLPKSAGTLAVLPAYLLT